MTVHGFDLLVAWIVFFEIAGLYFGSAVLLNARMVTPSLTWPAFLLMVVGAVPVNLGYILFAVGALVGVLLFFLANLVVARAERRLQGSLPLVTYGLATAALLATYTLLSGALVMVPAFFWSPGLMETYDPGYYRNMFWSFGHPAQQINLAARVASWYALAGPTVRARVRN